MWEKGGYVVKKRKLVWCTGLWWEVRGIWDKILLYDWTKHDENKLAEDVNKLSQNPLIAILNSVGGGSGGMRF